MSNNDAVFTEFINASNDVTPRGASVLTRAISQGDALTRLCGSRWQYCHSRCTFEESVVQ